MGEGQGSRRGGKSELVDSWRGRWEGLFRSIHSPKTHISVSRLRRAIGEKKAMKEKAKPGPRKPQSQYGDCHHQTNRYSHSADVVDRKEVRSEAVHRHPSSRDGKRRALAKRPASANSQANGKVIRQNGRMESAKRYSLLVGLSRGEQVLRY